MNISLVMTVIGPDRPGLVDTISGIVAKNGGNWLESRMSRLGGQFAGILRVQVSSEKETNLVTELTGLEQHGLKVVVLSDWQSQEDIGRKLTSLEIVGQDRPGIVSQISHILAQHGVNVEELNTGCDSAPMSGETHFRAHAKLFVPENCNMAKLRKDLEKIAADLIVELTIAELSA